MIMKLLDPTPIYADGHKTHDHCQEMDTGLLGQSFLAPDRLTGCLHIMNSMSIVSSLVMHSAHKTELACAASSTEG